VKELCAIVMKTLKCQTINARLPINRWAIGVLGLLLLTLSQGCGLTERLAQNALPVDEYATDDEFWSSGQKPVKPSASEKKARKQQYKQQQDEKLAQKQAAKKGKAAKPPKTPALTQQTNPSKGPSLPENNAGPSQPKGPKANQVNQVIAEAKSYIGTPYKWGGTSRSGMDCSGLVQISYRKIGIELPRVAGDQAAMGKPVTRNHIQPGDLLFFHPGNGKSISHTGLVVETQSGGKIFFIHASTSKGVRIDDLDEDYWAKRFLYGRRYLD
jgi:cell wall-associated NlpC family hydrolase